MISPVLWQGQKDLNPRHAVLEWMLEQPTRSGEGPVLPGFRCRFGAAGNLELIRSDNTKFNLDKTIDKHKKMR